MSRLPRKAGPLLGSETAARARIQERGEKTRRLLDENERLEIAKAKHSS